MFLTLCSHFTVPPLWKQSFHPCFECALHSKSDIIIAHILAARAGVLRSSILLRLRIFLFPLREDSIADHPHKLDPKTSIKPTSRPRQLSHRAAGNEDLWYLTSRTTTSKKIEKPYFTIKYRNHANNGRASIQKILF